MTTDVGNIPAQTPPTAEPARGAPAGVRPDADAACIAAVLGGERDRFAELIERYQSAVATVVRGYVSNAHSVEDVAQDVFLNAYTNLPQLRDTRLFFPWLLQIARHRAARHGRRIEAKSPPVPLTGTESIPMPERNSESHEPVIAAVEQLPAPYRETVILKYERGLSCKEIAEKEGVAIGTITSRLTRALMMLRASLSAPEASET